MDKTCPCGNVWFVHTYLLQRKKYCSKKCFYKYRTIPIWNKGLKGIHLSPATEIKKGQHLSPNTQFKKGDKPLHPIKKGERRGVKTEFTSARTKNEKNINWVGEDVGYFASHAWVQRTYGRANHCQNRDEQTLGFACSNKSYRFEWSFKPKKGFKRDVTLYQQLCKSCHAKYDRSK